MMSAEDEKKLSEYAKKYQANEYDQESVDAIVQFIVQNNDSEELVHYLIDLIGADKAKMLLALNAPRLLRLPALQRKD